MKVQGPRTICAHPKCKNYIGMVGAQKRGQWHCSHYCANNNDNLPGGFHHNENGGYFPGCAWKSSSASTKAAPDVSR